LLRTFLSESSVYYTRLLSQLEQLAPQVAEPASLRVSRQRCLLALGDLTRYAENSNDSPDWTLTTAYYLQVHPQLGLLKTPHVDEPTPTAPHCL
jgi:hypothetical protein